MSTEWPKVMFVCPECGKLQAEPLGSFCGHANTRITWERVEVVPSGPVREALEEASGSSTRERDFEAQRETSEALAVLRKLQRGGWQTMNVQDLIRELEGRLSDIASRVTTNA